MGIGMCCCANATAYFSGGFTGGASGVVATTDKLTFATGITAAQVSANLGVVRSLPFAVGDANGHAYIAGGSTAVGGGKEVLSSERLTFSSDTQSSLAAVLSQARYLGASTGDRSTKGYFCGGQTGTSGTNAPVVTTDKFTFASETISALSACNLTTGTQELAGTTDGSSKGYLSGGGTGASGLAAVSTTYRITFSSDTIATVAGAALSLARLRLCATSNGTTAAYFLGGGTVAPPISAVITADKLTFSSETTAAKTSARLLTATYYPIAVGDGATVSYIAGGFSSALTAAAESLTYSSETCANATTANLSVARDLHVGAASTGYG